MKRRILAILLVLIMISSLSASAFAAKNLKDVDVIMIPNQLFFFGFLWFLNSR